MGCEKATALVNEQFVGLRLDALPGQSETFCDLVEDRSERFFPAAAADLELRGVNLPAVAHRGVQDRFGSLSVRRAVRSFDQRRDLRWLHGKGDRAHGLDMQSRHRTFHLAVRAVVSGWLDRADRALELCVVAVP